jgi:hypothetical protein
MIFRISGHSGSAKSRMTRALRANGISAPQAMIVTSRLPRAGEAHGLDYYFLPRAAVAALPERDFFVGPVRNMLQAVDLVQLQMDLESNDLVLIEIFHELWPGLISRMAERVGNQLRTASVFMTAVDPDELRGLPDDAVRAERIRSEVAKILHWRGKDGPAEIQKRSESAVKEILEAIGPDGGKQYLKILHSSPEGPDHEDDWTREEQPVGRAKKVIEEFISIVKEQGQP